MMVQIIDLYSHFYSVCFHGYTKGMDIFSQQNFTSDVFWHKEEPISFKSDPDVDVESCLFFPQGI